MVDRLCKAKQFLGSDLLDKRTCKSCKDDAAKYCPSCAKRKFARHSLDD